MKNSLATKSNDRVRRINALHAEIQNNIGQINHLKEFTIAIAAKCGAELIALKEELPHGQFESQIGTVVPFSTRTARKYMALAEEMQERLPKNELSSLLDASVEKLAPKLNKLIEGRTLTQLMFDWDILKKKPKKAAPPDDHPDDDGPRDASVRRTHIWVNSVEDLLVKTPHHVRNLDRALLDRFNSILEEALTAVNPGRRFS